ncbi:MAG: PEP/pyruvate-binding domain-containing protein [Deltaproteobacteria bacterium]|nr:PEP/pyruvate-binding domain-containing protein [Deltaproteobacteria bacterium]
MKYYSHVSTGWKSLDSIIDNLRRGDNVVWQIDDIAVYRKVVSFFADSAISNNERVVYMRFGSHGKLLEPSDNLCIYTLDVSSGFESFSSEVHGIISREGKDVFYVFDSLSDLLHEWATDLMIVNFFFITCPYLFELNTIAYFAILRNCHSFKAIARIRETTQILIDVYSYKQKLCVHPIKIQDRYSPTMFFPHINEGSELVPVINSVEANLLFSDLLREKSVDSRWTLDFWDRLFIQAEKLLQSNAAPEEKQDKVEQLSRLLLGRNKRIVGLIREFMTLDDLIQIKERLIGTGFIGGKALGMLLARKILLENASLDWQRLLEHHDSFYIGSDVFYSYIVQNGWWKLFMEHKTKDGYFTKASELRDNILRGSFPENIKERFQFMLEYFGQSPIIVRSSSLLEDAFGNAFAGKYESFFCVNQASPEKRYAIFEDAVKQIFASTMNEDALNYRLQRGLDLQDEQMAILVQRVSGSYHKSCFFPAIAGVGLSYNPYVWKKNMNPDAGMLRLVMGLGTRAVNRVENDYPRIVAMDDPLVKPLSGMRDIKRYSQHYVDYLNLEANELQTISLWGLEEKELDINLESIAVKDTEYQNYGFNSENSSENHWILTFDNLLTQTSFVDLMGKMLRILGSAYGTPVDIEFTVNYNQADEIQINLLQCRPFQTSGVSTDTAISKEIDAKKIFIQTEGTFMGGNVSLPISCVIWVDPEDYAALSMSEKYSVARLIGRLNKRIANRKTMPTMLMGPGRWGTKTPAMGVPVTFSEINNITALIEISYQSGSMIPDLSFGTHFFHDLTETNIFYAAIYPERSDVVLNTALLDRFHREAFNIEYVEDHFRNVVKVYDLSENKLIIQSDVITQKMICHRM